MDEYVTNLSICTKTGEIDWVAVKKPGGSRFVKIYNKADFANSAISLEQILKSVRVQAVAPLGTL